LATQAHLVGLRAVDEAFAVERVGGVAAGRPRLVPGGARGDVEDARHQRRRRPRAVLRHQFRTPPRGPAEHRLERLAAMQVRAQIV
jgi:hypothetical protein